MITWPLVQLSCEIYLKKKKAAGLLRHRNQWRLGCKSDRRAGSRSETKGLATSEQVNLLSDLRHKSAPYGMLHNKTLCFHYMTNIASEGTAVFLQALHVLRL